MMDMGGCSGSELFALRVLGDSMTPEFEDGAIIIIDPAGVVESGRYVLAVHDGEYIFRQLIIEDDRYFLKPLNEGYDTLKISGLNDIKGVIIQKAGTRRRHRKHYVGVKRAQN
jgi:DNA polymerase V